jgi:hypothetical protein
VATEEGPDGPAAHDHRRLRGAHRLLVGGSALGLVAAATIGLAGGTGGFGLVALLLGVMVGCVLAAAHLAILAVVDEFRERRVAARRPVEAFGLFLAALFLMLLVMGAAGAMADGPASEAATGQALATSGPLPTAGG